MIYHFASYKQIFTFVYKLFFSHARDVIYFFSLHYMALYVHDLLANKLPSSFDNFPVVNHSQHDRITRQYNNLPQTLARTQFSARTPYHAIPALWNNLPYKQQNREQASRK